MPEHPKGWKLMGDALEHAIAEVEPESELIRPTRKRRRRKWGICPRCNRDVRKAGGCKRFPHTLNGKERDPIPVGNKRDLLSVRPPYRGVRPGERCRDCNALYSCLHHPGCKLEACPWCPMPAYRCNCH